MRPRWGRHFTFSIFLSARPNRKISTPEISFWMACSRNGAPIDLRRSIVGKRRTKNIYLILNLFFTASRNKKISTALSGTCPKDSTKLTPSGMFSGKLASLGPKRHR